MENCNGLREIVDKIFKFFIRKPIKGHDKEYAVMWRTLAQESRYKAGILLRHDFPVFTSYQLIWMD